MAPPQTEVAGIESAEWMIAAYQFPEIQRQAEDWVARMVGQLAVAQEVSIIPVAERPAESATLLASVQEAALGNTEARCFVQTNVATDLIERNRTVAHQNTVWLDLVDNRPTQTGVDMLSVLQNTLINTRLDEEMTTRTMYETTNAFVLTKLIEHGVLETHDAVILEPAPENAATRRDFNFHTETETMSAQLFSKQNDKLRLQTAMVAGKKDAKSPRHDLQAIQAMAEQHDIEPLQISGPSEAIRYLWLVPKTAVPHGIEDIVQELDDCSGGTFYGQDRPRQDYQQYAAECELFNQSFDTTVQLITNQLIGEAAAFSTPTEATERLDYLSGRYSVRRAVEDYTIDPRIFGAPAAQQIEKARLFRETGQEEEAEQATIEAQAVETSSSCPMRKSEEKSSKSEEEKQGSRKWMKCPYCKAKVYDDPCAKVLCCWDCGAKVVAGTVLSKGNGGSRARAERQTQPEPVEEVEAAPKEKTPELATAVG